MNKKTARILAIDDNEDNLISLELLLKAMAKKVDTATNPELIPDLMKAVDYDVILLDMNFSKDSISGQEGFFWLEKILAIDPQTVVIFITAYGDVEKSVRAIKAGAMDFVLKPWENEKLLATVSAGLQLRQSRRESSSLRERQGVLSAELDQPFNDFIGRSPKMLEIFKTIRKVGKTDASVLILGENGTGKELVARSLHRHSLRHNEVFISVDLGAIHENLFESELFGHTKGAFTDARQDRSGRFEIASGGTLFLDEIGNLSLPLQAKLLTVIEKQEIVRVGTNKPRPVDVRLICATNLNLHQMSQENTFRQDLLYRINTVEIHLPPLRERIEDIEELANHYLEKYSKKYKKGIKTISTKALAKLEKYNWPGNIRELQHAIERAVILSEGDTLTPMDFLLSQNEQSGSGFEFESLDLEVVEKQVIATAMHRHKGNVTNAAKEVGLTRGAFYRRLEKYGL